MGKLLVLLFIILSLQSWSQDSVAVALPDTTAPQLIKKPVVRPRIIKKDSTAIARDSLAKLDSIAVADSIKNTKALRPSISLFKPLPFLSVWNDHPVFRFTDPMRYSVTEKKWIGKEAIFYSMIGLLLFFALIKNGFGRYIQDLFSSYFRTTVKQKQIKEQLLQNPLPSMLLNLFFTLSIGMFLALLFQYFKLGLEFNFWLLYLYCVVGLVCVYALKFVSLKLLGWIFQVSTTIDSYIFIVFTTNKIIGILLLPFLVVLAFTKGVVNEAAMSLSIMVVFGLIAYRFFLSFISIRGQIRLSFLHFLIYLFAFEIIPLLLINKLLFTFLG